MPLGKPCVSMANHGDAVPEATFRPHMSWIAHVPCGVPMPATCNEPWEGLGYTHNAWPSSGKGCAGRVMDETHVSEANTA